MARTYGTQTQSSDAAKNPGSTFSVLAASSSQIVAANPGRVLLVITNDGANAVYLSLGGTAAVGSGIRLNASGGAITLREYTGAVSARAATGDTAIGIAEV